MKMNNDVINAHDHSINNKTELLESKMCGCFHCLAVFPPEKIERWLKDKQGTGLCPYCGTDSLIADKSGYPVTTEFLKEMQKKWFSYKVLGDENEQ